MREDCAINNTLETKFLMQSQERGAIKIRQKLLPMIRQRQKRSSRGGMGRCIPPNIFRKGNGNAFITPNFIAIAIKHSMSEDGWQRRE